MHTRLPRAFLAARTVPAARICARVRMTTRWKSAFPSRPMPQRRLLREARADRGGHLRVRIARNSPDSPIPRDDACASAQLGAPHWFVFCFDCCQASIHGEGDGDEGNRGAQEDPHGQRARGRKYSPFTLPWLAFWNTYWFAALTSFEFGASSLSRPSARLKSSRSCTTRTSSISKRSSPHQVWQI